MKNFSQNLRTQAGSSLIEVLVALLILSFGMLALGAMLSFAVQTPKTSAYRATANNLASSYVERMRANPVGFANNDYANPLSYNNEATKLQIEPAKVCLYPLCNALTIPNLGSMDFEEVRVAVRAELPSGGIFMSRDGTGGNLWVVWNEPNSNAAFLDASVVDNCPVEVTGTYADPKPRCLYMRFEI